MLILTVCAPLLAIILFAMFFRNTGVIYARRLAIPALCIVFVLCLLIFSKTAVAAASRGLNLWFDIVFPSLFPFFVASEILNATGFAKAAGILLEPVMRPVFNIPGSGSLALLMGIASGYPTGAKITCDLRMKGAVTKTEAERLLAFSNNSGPLFITGAVATGMYGAPALGLFLLACHIAACLTVGVLFRFYGHEHTPPANARKDRILARFRQELRQPPGSSGTNAATLFGDAVRNSISLILAIGGFIILFSVIINLLLDSGVVGLLASASATVLSPLGIDKNTVTALISGFFEITTGSSLTSALKGIPLTQQLPAASFIIGWAGLSVHSQVLSITGRTDISIKPYLFGKLLQGVLAAMYTWMGLKLFGVGINPSSPVMKQFQVSNPGWLETASLSLIELAAIIAFFILLFIGSKSVRSKNTRL